MTTNRICADSGHLANLIGEALMLADQAVVCDIETHAYHAGLTTEGRFIWDLRPMVDPREAPDDVIEMATLAIGYARRRGLISQAGENEMLVVINRERA